MRLSRSLPTLLITLLAGWGCTPSDSPSGAAATPELLKNTYCAGGFTIREPGAARNSSTMLRIHFPNGEESGGLAVLENLRVKSWSQPPISYPFYERHYGVNRELPVQIVSSRDDLKKAEADENIKLYAFFDKNDRSRSPNFLSKEEFLTQMGKKPRRYEYLEFDRSLTVSVRNQKAEFAYLYIKFVPCESYEAPSLRMKGTPGNELEYGLLYSDSRFPDSKNGNWAKNIRVLRPQLPIRFTTMSLEDLERESWCKMDSDLEVYTFRNGKVASSNFLLPYFDANFSRKEIRFAEYAAPTAAGEIEIVNNGLPSLSLAPLQIYRDAKNLEYIALANRNSGYHITSYYIVRCSDPRFKQLYPQAADWIKAMRNLHLEKL